MGYQGAKLRRWFQDDGAIDRGCRRMASHMAGHMTAVVKQNTPIDKGTLRAEIHEKLMVVYPNERGEMVYETGSESNLEYAPYVEEGTGLWGPSHAKYVIRPKRPDGWLRWIDPLTGQPVFAKEVMHPGSPGNHMFAIGTAIAEHEFEREVTPIVRDVMRDLERSILRHRVIGARRIV